MDRFRPDAETIAGFLLALGFVVAFSAFSRAIRTSSEDVERAEEQLLSLPAGAAADELRARVADVWWALYARAMKTSALKRRVLLVAALFLYAAVIGLFALGATELEQ